MYAVFQKHFGRHSSFMEQINQCQTVLSHIVLYVCEYLFFMLDVFAVADFRLILEVSILFLCE